MYAKFVLNRDLTYFNKDSVKIKELRTHRGLLQLHEMHSSSNHPVKKQYKIYKL